MEQQSLFKIPIDVITSLASLDTILPTCPPTKRQMPNEVVRSALFCAKNRRSLRPFFKKEKIAVIGGGEIIYTGEELRQDDEVVWMHLIHLASKIPLGEPICFTPYEFLRCLKKTACKPNYEWLHCVLTRMQATAVQFYSQRLEEGVSASLITRFVWKSDETKKYKGKWAVWMEPSMRRLFDQTSYLDWQQRLDVPEGIASKLMGYWASHAKPYPVNIETLRHICKNESQIKDFKKKLIIALNALKDVGFLDNYIIVGSKVSIVRV